MRKETGHSQTHKDMEKRFKINELLSGFLLFSLYEFVNLFVFIQVSTMLNNKMALKTQSDMFTSIHFKTLTSF